MTTSNKSIQQRIEEAVSHIEKVYDTYYDPSRVLNITELSFSLCLGAISAARKVPGIDQHQGFERLYICQDDLSKGMVAQHLRDRFGITDFDSLVKVGNQMFSTGQQYKAFLDYWQQESNFKLEMLTPEGQEAFLIDQSFANYFYPYIKEKGMFAWDCNERIGLIRTAYACEIITFKECFNLIQELTATALKTYSNWKEYAIACLCGGAYFMFRYDREIKDGLNFLATLEAIILHLIKDDRVWLDAPWKSLN